MTKINRECIISIIHMKKTTEIREELALMQKEKDKLELKLAAADPEQKLSFIPNVFLHPGKASLTHRKIDL